MELQEFPIGKKIFTFPKSDSLALLSKKDLIEKIQALTEELRQTVGDDKPGSLMLNALRNAGYYAKNLLINGDDNGNPVYLLNHSHTLNQYSDYIYPKQVSKATKYQRSSEYAMLDDFPVLPNSLISFGETKVDGNDYSTITLHNMPYEGELVKSDKFKEVNKLITTKTKELTGKIKMTSVICGNEITLPEGMSGYKASTSDAAEDMLPRFIRYLEGTASFEDELEVGRTMGVIDTSWRNSRQTFFITDKKPKIPTSIRTRLYFLMGAYQLPENWEEWFDA